MAVKITNYKKDYKQAFYDLNVEWLETYFYVEPFDKEVLSNPEQYIINKGGFIFFALVDDEAIGTVALMPTVDEAILELTKMAVTPSMKGHGIGQRLMQHCITFALEENYKKLILYSNRILENAIHIYKKYGFKEIDLEPNTPYKRSNIKMELDLNTNFRKD